MHSTTLETLLMLHSLRGLTGKLKLMGNKSDNCASFVTIYIIELLSVQIMGRTAVVVVLPLLIQVHLLLLALLIR